VQPATELAVAGCVLQRLTCVGRADRRALAVNQRGDKASVEPEDREHRRSSIPNKLPSRSNRNDELAPKGRAMLFGTSSLTCAGGFFMRSRSPVFVSFPEVALIRSASASNTAN
jgi:hypothetical protein